MDFRDSGLPQDPTLFKAFTTYMQNMKEAPEQVRDQSLPLRTAQLLGTTANDNQAATVALLQVMPPDTWGVIEKRFGKDAASALKDFHRHNNTGYAYLKDASPIVKQLTLAGAILNFDDFQKVSERLDQQIDQLMMSGEGNLAIPMAPPAMFFDKVGNAAMDTSGAPQLEEMFLDKLYTYRATQAALAEKLESLGMQIPGMTPERAPAEVRYPLFEETDLYDSPKVRAAYDTLVNHTRVLPEDFEAALSVGRLLSTVSPSVNPTAVAASLLDVGIRDLNKDDLEFMKDRFDWDVLEVLNTASVYSVQTPTQILKAPVEFRQIAVANAIAVLNDAQKGGEHILQMAEENPQLPKGFVHQNFIQLKRMGAMTAHVIRPVLGTTDLPELDTLFENKLKVFNAFTDQHLPEQGPAPKPQELKPENKNKPKPPGFGGGQSFSM